MDRRLDTAAQVAVAVAETLFIHPNETLEVVGKSPIEDRPLGTAGAIDTRARSCGYRLHPEGRDGIGERELALAPWRPGSGGH